MLTGIKSFLRCLQTIAIVLLGPLSGSAAFANPAILEPYESLQWLKLGSTRQSDVVRAIGQPAAIIDVARFRSEIIDRRSEYAALGLSFWYLLDGEADPKVNQVLFEPPFKGQSSLGLGLGTGRDELMQKLGAFFKTGTIDKPDFVELLPLSAGYPNLDLWFKNDRLSGVRLTAFLPPSANADRDKARVAALVRQENVQDGFVETPRCEYIFRLNRNLKLLGQQRIGVAESNVNWRLELHENKQNGAWTLLGYSKFDSSFKGCELAGGDVQGANAGSAYRASVWYPKYFR